MTYSPQQNTIKWEVYEKRILSEYLSVRGQFEHVTPELLKIFSDGKIGILKRLAAALSKTSSGHSDLPLIYSAIHDLRRMSAEENSPGPGKGRKPTVSIPLKDVKAVDIERIQNSQFSARQRHLIYALREVLGAARRVGISEVVNIESFKAFGVELNSRDIRHKSKRIKIGDCKDLARIWGLDADEMILISNEYRAKNLLAEHEPSIRHSDFRAAPLSPIDYAKLARIASEEAFQCSDGRQSIHRLFLTAAALALLSFIPERVSDILKLTIGHQVKRDLRGWSSEYFSNKTSDDRSVAYLPDQLTPYLDDLVLLGADPGAGGKNFLSLYRHRMEVRSPLFARIDLMRTYSATRIFQWVKDRSGHGPNAARKAMSDYIAEIGGTRLEVMVLLGHRRASTSIKHYDVRAGAIRRKTVVESLDLHRQDLMGRGEIRLPSGKLIDVAKICKDLDRADQRPTPVHKSL